MKLFLPTPLAVVWVNRLTFSSSSSSSSSPSPPSPSSHLQLVSLRYRKCRGGRGSLAVYAILFFTMRTNFYVSFDSQVISNIHLHCEPSWIMYSEYLVLQLHTPHLSIWIGQIWYVGHLSVAVSWIELTSTICSHTCFEKIFKCFNRWSIIVGMISRVSWEIQKWVLSEGPPKPMF